MIAHEKTERTSRMHSTTRATQPVCVIRVSSWLEKTNCARTEIVLPPGKSFENRPANTVAHAQGRVKRINNLQEIPDVLHDTELGAPAQSFWPLRAVCEPSAAASVCRPNRRPQISAPP